MARKIKIGLADDHIMVRKAIIRLIGTFEDYSILFEADNGNDLKNKIVSVGVPDIVLMDINMPNGNGFDTTAWLHKHYPLVKVLALSMLNDETAIIRILRLGAKGYILKTMEPEELGVALDAIMRHDFYLPESISGKVVSGLQNFFDMDRQAATANEKEIEFLQLICTELSYREIAMKMNISPRTVDVYRTTLCERFNVRTRVGLAIFAIKNGLVTFTNTP